MFEARGAAIFGTPCMLSCMWIFLIARYN